jgi:sucrose-6-phosphate hydrolase SacC (GH32 family)
MLLHFCHHFPSGSRYYLGRYQDQQFIPETFDRINWPGGNIHAPRTLLDDRGRRILFANLNEGRSMASCQASGWYGVMSLPVVISLAADGNAICYEPASELEALRHHPQQRTGIAIGADSELLIPDIHGACLELEIEIESHGAAEFGLKVRCAPDGSEETLVSLALEPAAVEIDFRRASRREDLAYAQDLEVQSAPIDLEQGQRIKLRIFLDRSVLEVFAGDQRYLAQRIFPTHPQALGLKLFSRGGPAFVRYLRAWQMGGNECD